MMRSSKIETPESSGADTPTSPEEAIALFEGVLQTNPEDQGALAALATAYGQAGDALRARVTLLRLAKVLVAKKDSTSAKDAIEALRPLAADDFDALEALNALETLVKENPPVSAAASSSARVAAAVTPLPSGVALGRIILDREMRLAWDLLEAKEINQDEYATAIDDLTVQTADSRGNRTVSLLHALVDRAVPGFDRIVRYLTSRGKCPYVDLNSFDVVDVSLNGLPKEYLIRQGAIVFETCGDELLVGLLNPVDSKLKSDIESRLARPCHFYFVTPESFDAAWAKRLSAS